MQFDAWRTLWMWVTHTCRDRRTVFVTLVSDAGLIARVFSSLPVVSIKGNQFGYQCPLLRVRLTVVGRFPLSSGLISASTGRVAPGQRSTSRLRPPFWSNRVERAEWSRLPASRIASEDNFRSTYRERPFWKGLGSAVTATTPAHGHKHRSRLAFLYPYLIYFKFDKRSLICFSIFLNKVYHVLFKSF